MTLPATQKIRDVSDIVTKGTTPTTVGRNYTSRGINFLKVETFTSDGIFIPGKQGHIDESTHQLLKRSQLAEGDILFSIAGALGRSTIVDKSWLPANTNQAFAIIRPSSRNQAINPRYLLWQLRSPAIAKRIAEINVQAAQANLSLEQVREFDLLSLPRAEQNVIAAALDDVDQLVAALKRLVSKKQAIKQGLIQELLSGKTRLPGFQESWVQTKIGKLASVVGGGTPSTKTPSYWNGDIPWFTPGEISKNGSGLVKSSERSITSEGLQRSGAKLLPANSILVTSRASLGHCAVAEVPVATNQGFTSLVPKDSQSSWFLYYWMQHNRHELQTRAAGSTFLEISSAKVESIPITIPSIREQEAIAEVLRDADNEINALNRRLESVRSIKQGMMQELLTGRTRLPNKEAVE